jgi:L-alanine-DL-glutamate epimerase-like enolase superfamily enzyme
VPLTALLSGDLPAAGRAARERGIRTVKVKVGVGDFSRELGALHALRRAEPGLALRLDANQAFSLADAPRVLRALAELRPELVEEPIVDGFLGELTSAPVPIAADESLAGPWLALEPALRTGVVRAVVLKPMALGGITRCLELAARAQALGAGVVVTHLWDGPVGLATAAALALALPGALASGLGRHPALAAYPALTLAGLGDAILTPSDHPGLGLA